jgi:hypothetical protein
VKSPERMKFLDLLKKHHNFLSKVQLPFHSIFDEIEKWEKKNSHKERILMREIGQNRRGYKWGKKFVLDKSI